MNSLSFAIEIHESFGEPNVLHDKVLDCLWFDCGCLHYSNCIGHQLHGMGFDHLYW